MGFKKRCHRDIPRVHLLLFKSLLIVLDEFEKKIMYIVSQIFFVVIQLLYAVACVAVSNLLKSVLFHESNTSSCHFAIAS